MERKKKIILVVDDAPSNIQLLSGVLKGTYTVKAATSGEKALEVTHKQPQPDLILLDVIMPEMDGYEVCKRLKEDISTRAIPVIFISGNLTDKQEQRGLDMGAVACFGKPLDTGKLLEHVELLFR